MSEERASKAAKRRQLFPRATRQTLTRGPPDYSCSATNVEWSNIFTDDHANETGGKFFQKTDHAHT